MNESMDEFEESLQDTFTDEEFDDAVVEISGGIALAGHRLSNQGRHNVLAELIKLRNRLQEPR